MNLEIVSEKEYSDFVQKQKDSLFFQSVEWAKFKGNTGWSYEFIALTEGKKIKAAAMLLRKKVPFLKKDFYYSPRGFIIDYNDYNLVKQFSKLLKKYLKEKNAVFLKINPYIEYQQRDKNWKVISNSNKDDLIKLLKNNGYKHYGFYKKVEEKKELEPRWLSVLTIESKSMEQILSEMRSTTRLR